MLSVATSAGAPSISPTTDSSATHLNDACALLALMVQSQCTTQASSKGDVEIDFKKLQDLKQQLADAVQKAKDAADSSGFFGFLSSVFGSDVAQIAGAVAAVAAIVASGGAAAPLILLAVSAALEEGAKIGAKLGLDPKVCMVISLVGAAVGICSGAGTAQASTTVTTVAEGVKTGAQIAQAGASATGTVFGYVSQHYQANQLGFQADATGAQAQHDATNIDFDSALSLLQEALRTEQRETTTVSTMIQSDSSANNALSDRI